MSVPWDRTTPVAARFVDEALAAASRIGKPKAAMLEAVEAQATGRLVDVLVERDIVAEDDLAIVREVRRRQAVMRHGPERRER